MYDHWNDVASATLPTAGAALDERDRQIIATLLEELRDLTLSRRSHAAATEYVRKLTGRH